MTPKQFLKLAEKNGWKLQAIKKEVPVGSGRWLLLGFEYKKSSRKYRTKYMFPTPVLMSELAKGPIKQLTDEKTTDTDNAHDAAATGSATASADDAGNGATPDAALPPERGALPDALGSSAESSARHAPTGTPAEGRRPTLATRFQRWLGRKG
jgi:hypothetical protein